VIVTGYPAKLFADEHLIYGRDAQKARGLRHKHKNEQQNKEVEMPTVKQLLALAAVLFTLSGCATKKNFYATDGSRADGTVDMAYDFAQFEQPVIDIAQAKSIAKLKCRVWGYSDAEAFGGSQQNCHQANGYGTCIASQIVPNTSALVTSAKRQ
jgi:hypothetical protein